MFVIHGHSGTDEVVFEGDSSHVHGIGAGLNAGTVRVFGNAGPEAGRGMTGGELLIEDHAGDRLAAGLSGGTIRVGGNAGHDVGAPAFGSLRGMTGGIVSIGGSVGDRLGNRMRRGTIIVGGQAGDDTAADMLAGTIILMGSSGQRTAAGMRRGSLVCLGEPPILPLTFGASCHFRPQFLLAYLKTLSDLMSPLPKDVPTRTFHRFCGDLLSGGRGECLVADH